MNKKNLTALGSCFARAFHSEDQRGIIFNDYIAKELLSEEEYKFFFSSFSRRITSYIPNFKGDERDAVRYVMNSQLLGPILSRNKLCEEKIYNAVKDGSEMYLNIGAGYDTFAYRYNNKNFKICEVDIEEVQEDKKKRLKRRNLCEGCQVEYYSRDMTDPEWFGGIDDLVTAKKPIVVGILGFSYYITKADFIQILRDLSLIIPFNSKIVFDFATPINGHTGEGRFTYNEMKSSIIRQGFHIVEIFDSEKMEQKLFADYNRRNVGYRICLPDDICYVIAKKERGKNNAWKESE